MRAVIRSAEVLPEFVDPATNEVYWRMTYPSMPEEFWVMFRAYKAAGYFNPIHWTMRAWKGPNARQANGSASSYSPPVGY